MSDQPFYAPDHKPAPCQRQPGEHLSAVGRTRWRLALTTVCVLRWVALGDHTTSVTAEVKTAVNDARERDTEKGGKP
jgi:hypothetical protein